MNSDVRQGLGAICAGLALALVALLLIGASRLVGGVLFFGAGLSAFVGLVLIASSLLRKPADN